MRRIVVLVVVALTLIVPSGAVAAKRHATTNPVALAVHLAERYWQQTPCPVRVLPGKVSANEEWAVDPAFQELIAAGDLTPAAWTEAGMCAIYLNVEGPWNSWLNEDGNFHLFCDTITHEIGHLLGIEDRGQTNPRSITYPVLEAGTPNFNSVPQCRNVVVYYGHFRLRD